MREETKCAKCGAPVRDGVVANLRQLAPDYRCSTCGFDTRAPITKQPEPQSRIPSPPGKVEGRMERVCGNCGAPVAESRCNCCGMEKREADAVARARRPKRQKGLVERAVDAVKEVFTGSAEGSTGEGAASESKKANGGQS